MPWTTWQQDTETFFADDTGDWDSIAESFAYLAARGVRYYPPWYGE